MNPMIQKYLGSLIRTLLAGVIPFLVSIGMTLEDTEKLVTLLAGAIGALAWSMWEKRSSRKETLVALAMPKKGTLDEAKAVVASGAAPSVATPASEVPVLKPATAPGT